MAMLFLLASCLVVGVFIGAVGIGGVLLVPALMMFARLSVHQAAATALFSFLFTGLLGGGLFSRRGTIDWKVAGPVCAGAFALSFAGAAVGGRIPAAVLMWIIAAILLAAGLYIVLPNTRKNPEFRVDGNRRRMAALLGMGAVSGFGAGISGAGGPLFSVPLMLAFQFDPLVAVGTGQVVQIASSFSGSLRNMSYGSIQYGLALPVTLVELIGVLMGVRIAHFARGNQLRFAAAVLCMISAVGMAAKTLA
jgi:uncharacterized membrane protein YfcA